MFGADLFGPSLVGLSLLFTDFNYKKFVRSHLADDVLDLADNVVNAAHHDEFVVAAGRHAQHGLAAPLGHGLPEEPRRLVVVTGQVRGSH